MGVVDFSSRTVPRFRASSFPVALALHACLIGGGCEEPSNVMSSLDAPDGAIGGAGDAQSAGRDAADHDTSDAREADSSPDAPDSSPTDTVDETDSGDPCNDAFEVRTQADVDALGSLECESVSSLEIANGMEDISSLRPLSGLRRVHGDMSLWELHEDRLNELPPIAVGGTLILGQLHARQLPVRLTRAAVIVVYENPLLETVSPLLEHLVLVDDEVRIIGNPRLPRCQFDRIRERLWIELDLDVEIGWDLMNCAHCDDRCFELDENCDGESEPPDFVCAEGETCREDSVFGRRWACESAERP